VGIVVQSDDGCGAAVKENNGGKWSSDGVVSGGPGRVGAGGGGADSIL
jgi:hypothetical protein